MEIITFGTLYLSMVLTPIIIRIVSKGLNFDDKEDLRYSMLFIGVWAWGFANYLMKLIETPNT